MDGKAGATLHFEAKRVLARHSFSFRENAGPLGLGHTSAIWNFNLESLKGSAFSGVTVQPYRVVDFFFNISIRSLGHSQKTRRCGHRTLICELKPERTRVPLLLDHPA